MKRLTASYVAGLSVGFAGSRSKRELLATWAAGACRGSWECLADPKIRSDGMVVCGCGVELGLVDQEQMQQLDADPYLVEDIPPEQLHPGLWADLDPDLGKGGK
jgi:hypothetical protein